MSQLIGIYLLSQYGDLLKLNRHNLCLTSDSVSCYGVYFNRSLVMQWQMLILALLESNPLLIFVPYVYDQSILCWVSIPEGFTLQVCHHRQSKELNKQASETDFWIALRLSTKSSWLPEYQVTVCNLTWPANCEIQLYILSGSPHPQMLISSPVFFFNLLFFQSTSINLDLFFGDFKIASALSNPIFCQIFIVLSRD